MRLCLPQLIDAVIRIITKKNKSVAIYLPLFTPAISSRRTVVTFGSFLLTCSAARGDKCKLMSNEKGAKSHV